VVLPNQSDCLTIVDLSPNSFALRPQIFIKRTVPSTPVIGIMEESDRTLHVPLKRYSTNTQSLRNLSVSYGQIWRLSLTHLVH